MHICMWRSMINLTASVKQHIVKQNVLIYFVLLIGSVYESTKWIKASICSNIDPCT